MKYIFKISIILTIFVSVVFINPIESSVVCAKTNTTKNLKKDTGTSTASETSTSYTGVVDEAKPEDSDIPTTSDGVTGVIRHLLGFLQAASALMSVVVIAFNGFQYILAADAEMKSEMKKKMLPLVIGLVLVFSASSITLFLLGAVGAN